MKVDGAAATAAQTEGSFYCQATIQFSAADGPSRHQIDKHLGKVVKDAMGDDGVIDGGGSKAILVAITDAGKYIDAERPIARMLWAACDDRKDVEFDGSNVKLTDEAKVILKHGLSKFWGEQGPKARESIKALEDGSERVRPNKYI